MRRVVVAGAVAILVVAGLLVARVGRDDRSSMVTAEEEPSAVEEVPPSGSAVAATAADPEPDDEALTEVDVEGARAAAVAAVSRTREVIEAGMLVRRDLIAEFATPDFAPVLAERTSQQWVDLVFGLRRAAGHAVEVELLSQPVTAIAAAVTADRVMAQVWTVTVLVAAGESPAPEVWSTIHLDMVQIDGRWLVDGWDVTMGPAPAPPPEGTFASDEEIVAVMAWPAAGAGGR